jgi:hypothetical protein
MSCVLLRSAIFNDGKRGGDTFAMLASIDGGKRDGHVENVLEFRQRQACLLLVTC